MKDIKQQKIILLTYADFKKGISKVLTEVKFDYLVFIYFGSNMSKNLQMLEEAKRYFLSKFENKFLQNIIILSEREFLANDLQVKAIITPQNINEFDFFNFTNDYENTIDTDLDSFLLNNRIKYNYNLDIYNEENPWIYFQNKTGVLLLNKYTHNKIMENYHKVQCIIPEIIIVIFSGEEDEKLIKLLKLIGADAHITLGIINNKDLPYTKRTDAYVYINSSEYEKIALDFINDFLKLGNYPEALIILREFMKIPEKNFEADMTYDEEREIAKKDIKYYELKISSGTSLKNEVILNNEDELILNLGLQKKYIFTKKNKIAAI